MDSRPRKILLVEDDEDDYILTKALIGEAQAWKYQLHWVSRYEDALEALGTFQPDVMLIDYDLGAQNGLELVREAARRGFHVPAVMLTGRGNYEIDLEAMHSGATDYLVKGEVTAPMLERALRYAMEQQQSKDMLRQANDELESRVQERTKELQAEITERKRVAAELAEVQRRLLESVETERLQLAQELHDGPMQDIYSVVFQLQVLQGQSPDEQLSERIAELHQTLQQVNQSLRATAGELRPPALAPYGLEKAFRSHAENFCQTHPDLEIHLDLMADRQLLPEGTRLALFRIYQQALANIIRHAQATHVDVRFFFDEKLVTLEIQDNGRGFVMPKNLIDLVRAGHLGIAGAHERAEAIGGQLKVESKPGEGTLIRVTVPTPSQS